MRVIQYQVLKAFFFATLVARTACTASAESSIGAGAEILNERNSAAAPVVAIATDPSTTSSHDQHHGGIMAMTSSVSSLFNAVDTFFDGADGTFNNEESNGVRIRGYLNDESHSSAKVRKGNESSSCFFHHPSTKI